MSFSSEDESIAKSIKNGLTALEDRCRLEIFFSPDLRGGADYREQIKEFASSADLFLLIYPNESRNYSWCWFELGCFHTTGIKHTICLRNPHIRSLPPQVEAWQAYNADENGLRRLFSDLFVNGTFSGGRSVNAGVDSDEHFRSRRDEWVATIADNFAHARVREKFFPKRITITDKSGKSAGIDFRKAEVTGAASVFGIADGPMEWDLLKRTAKEKHKTTRWMDRLEETQRDLARGAIGGSLPPIETGNEALTFPVVSRVEAFDDILKLVNVIFVDVPRSDLEGYFDEWIAPKTMPDRWVSLIRVCNYSIKFRWNFLVPLENDLNDEAADPADVLDALIGGLKIYRNQAAKFFKHRVQVEAIFDREYRDQVESAVDEYAHCLEGARSLATKKPDMEKPVITKRDVESVLDRLKAVNATFLTAASGQFSVIVSELSRRARSTRAAAPELPRQATATAE